MFNFFKKKNKDPKDERVLPVTDDLIVGGDACAIFDTIDSCMEELDALNCGVTFKAGVFDASLWIDNVEDVCGATFMLPDGNGNLCRTTVSDSVNLLDVDKAGEYMCIYEIEEKGNEYVGNIICIAESEQYSFFSEIKDMYDKNSSIRSYIKCTREQRAYIAERHYKEPVIPKDKESNARRSQRNVITDSTALEMMFNLCKHTLSEDLQHQCQELISRTGRGRVSSSNMILADILYTCCESEPKKPFLSTAECLEVFKRKRYGFDPWIKDIIRQIRLLDRCDDSGAVFVLVGPPGTGKTDIAEAIAECTRKKFCVVNCRNKNGMEIGGAHKTYADSCHGEIQENLLYYGNDCCMLLDEFEKMVTTEKEGNPFALFVSAFDDRKVFVDSFTQVPVPTKNVIWIMTVNSIDGIPDYVRNRFQENIFVLDSYTAETKAKIAEHFIVPKYMKAYNFTSSEVAFTEEGLFAIAKTTDDSGARVTAQKIEKILCAVNEKLEAGMSAPVIVNGDFAITALKDTAKTANDNRRIGF